MNISNLSNELPFASSIDAATSAAKKSISEVGSFSSLLNSSESKETTAVSSDAPAADSEPLRKAFQDFVGQTLFSQMISSMRDTQQGAAYFNGGRAEQVFQGQLDQMLSEQLSDASASKFSDPMFKLFQLRRQS